MDGQPVTEVIEPRRIDEGWWREEALPREYWQLSLESGRTLTVFHDLIDDCWSSSITSSKPVDLPVMMRCLTHRRKGGDERPVGRRGGVAQDALSEAWKAFAEPVASR